MKTIIIAAAELLLIGLCLIALADGLARQADINQAAVAAHLEGR